MPDREYGIAQSPAPERDDLVSDGFDVDRYLGPTRAQMRDQLNGIMDQDELDSASKTHEFLRGIGISGDENLSAHVTYAKAISGQLTEKGLWGSIREGWSNNTLQLDIANIRIAEMNNEIGPDEADRQVGLIKKQMEHSQASGWFSGWFKSAAEIAPMVLDSSYEGIKTGVLAGTIGGGGAAIATAVAGQAGPQIATPEEVVTVPAAFVGGFAAGFAPGFASGTAVRGGYLEAGMMYDELKDIRDENGNRLDPSLMKSIASTVGVINGALELVQVDILVNSIPGGKKLISRATREAMKELSQRHILKSAVLKSLARYGAGVAGETITEVAQEADNVIFSELAKKLNNELNGTDFEPAKKDEIINRLVDIMKATAAGSSLLVLPGNVVHSAMQLGEAIPSAEPRAESPLPITRILSIRESESIIPRIDVSKMGVEPVVVPEMPKRVSVPQLRKQAAELGIDTSGISGKGTSAKILDLISKHEPTGTAEERAASISAALEKMPKRTSRTSLSVEEEYALKQTEATLKASEPYTITPNLYIGNVTSRMRADFAAAMKVDPDRVLGFMENGWPTKRTAIELTVREARDYLFHLENSLQERLDKNQINTHNDMAQANADWGDMKELRAKLGLPIGERPFTIIQDQATKVITIENIRERIAKAVEPSKAAEIVTTHLDRLNLVMRKVASATNKGYALGAKEQKRLYAELQYLRRQQELRDTMVLNIQKEPSDSVDFFYREAIKGIQGQLDFRKDEAEKTAHKDSLEKLIKSNPEKAADIPQQLIDMISKRDVDTLSYAQLASINAEIARLTQLGRLKSKLTREKQARAAKSIRSAILANVESAPKNILPSAERAQSLTPSRIFDTLDGGQDFKGEAHDFFYTTVDENTNAELVNTERRHETMTQRRKELGIGLGQLMAKRTVGNLRLSVDAMLSIYAGWKNAESRAALMYGGINYKDKSGPRIVLITDEIHTEIEKSLSEAEMLWADTIIQEYAENYNRLRNTVISVEKRDMGIVNNYTPILREGIESASISDDLMAEIGERQFYRNAGVQKGFTIDRKTIPPEYMKPVKIGLTAIWMRQVKKQEHYINHAASIKEMRSIVDSDFMAAVAGKFGQPIAESVDHYINTIANPDFYRTYSDMEHYSRLFRQHTAVAYIAYNLVTVAKQFPAVVMYWAKSSIGDMLGSTLNLVFRPMQAYNNALAIHPQLRDIAIEREMAEIKARDVASYSPKLATMRDIGFYGVTLIDIAMKVIGINAVYAKQIRDGASPIEAGREASHITTREQSGFNPKDRPKIYGTSEFLNWALLFTNQINRIYNIGTHDIPYFVRNKHYMAAARSALGLGIMAILIRAITTGRIPDDPEEAAIAVGEQALGSVPIIGGPLASIFGGYRPSAAPPQQAAYGLGRAAKAAYDGDMEKFVRYLAEPAAIIVGLPYSAPKKALKWIEAQSE